METTDNSSHFHDCESISVIINEITSHPSRYRSNIDIKSTLYDNKTYYWFESEEFLIGHEYKICTGKLFIPEEFGHKLSGELEFITRIPTVNHVKPCSPRCQAKTQWIYNTKVDYFNYKQYFYLPCWGYNDIKSKNYPQIGETWFWSYYCISENRLAFFEVLA